MIDKRWALCCIAAWIVFFFMIWLKFLPYFLQGTDGNIKNFIVIFSGVMFFSLLTSSIYIFTENEK